MIIFNIYILLLLSINILIVKSDVTFKVIAVEGTPYVSIGSKDYVMELDEYPIYKVTIKVDPPVDYCYKLNNVKESFVRQIKGHETLNEFFNRAKTVINHPQLPAAYKAFSGFKKSELFDDTYVSTIIIKAEETDIENLHNNVTPSPESTENDNPQENTPNLRKRVETTIPDMDNPGEEGGGESTNPGTGGEGTGDNPEGGDTPGTGGSEGTGSDTPGTGEGTGEGTGGDTPGTGEGGEGAGGDTPGTGGSEGTGGDTPGTGGSEGTGGDTPGTGGSEGTGGDNPGEGTGEGTGGDTPGTGGSEGTGEGGGEGTGGDTPGTGGDNPGTGGGEGTGGDTPGTGEGGEGTGGDTPGTGEGGEGAGGENNDPIENVIIHETEKVKIDTVEVIYVNPYTIKKFKGAKLSIITKNYPYDSSLKKLSYKIENLKTSDDKNLYGRSNIVLNSNYNDNSFLREKLSIDMLNTIGLPTAQAKYSRLYINNEEAGLYVLTDDIESQEFLKETFNNGEANANNNALFGVDSQSENIDLSYNKEEEEDIKYKYYDYKSDLPDVDKDAKFKEILLPFMKKVDGYPKKVKQINLNINSFVKSLAAEFTFGRVYSFWLNPKSYYIYNEAKKNKWTFIDTSFYDAFGYNTDDSLALCILETNLDDYIGCSSIDEYVNPFVKNILSKSDNKNLLKKVLKRLVQSSFNIKAIGPRIDSLADLIHDDVYWDFELDFPNNEKTNIKKIYDFGCDTKYFEIETSDSSELKYLPIKEWIRKKGYTISYFLEFLIPYDFDDSLGYFENPSHEKCNDGNCNS